jgi:hypothetical protein
LRISRSAASAVAPALDQHVEDLALVIDCTPQAHPLPGDPNDHLVEVPSRARAWAALPQLARDQRAEFQHPAPHRFIAACPGRDSAQRCPQLQCQPGDDFEAAGVKVRTKGGVGI